MKYLLFLSLVLLGPLQADTLPANKIIYMISPPRSLSVAFTRMMQARGDFEIFHEPSIFAYDKVHYPEFAESTFSPESFKTFAEVKNAIFTAATKKQVFVKEMSFAVADFLLQDSEFVQNEHIYFLFLVRNPHHSTISFYKRVETILSDFANLIGFEPLVRLFEEVKTKAKHTPVLVFAEDLYTDPYSTVERLCRQLEIPYLPQALSWNNLGNGFNGHAEWHEQKKATKDVQHWHGNAIQSQCFAPPASYEVDEDGLPTFSEIQDPIHKEACIEAWRYNLVFWEKLKLLAQ